jgi:hypothetical protein
MNTSGLFSGTSNPDSQSDAGTPDSGTDTPQMITADGSRNEHDESRDGEDGTGDNYFLHIDDSYDDEDGNEPPLLPGEDDPMELLFRGNI